MAIVHSEETKKDDLLETFFSASPYPTKKKPYKPFQQLKNYLLAIAIMSGQMLLGGTLFLKNDIHQAVIGKSNDLKWMVLVSGSEIEVDLVGANLKKLDGVGNVVFKSPTEVYQQLQSGPLSNDLRKEYLPAIWEVSWEGATLNPARLNELVNEVRRYPGVINVAHNPYDLTQILVEQHRWFQTRLILAAFGVVITLFFFVTLGRYLFFSKLKEFSKKEFFGDILFFGLIWALGAFLASSIWGPMGWGFYLIGLLPGAIKYFWTHSPQ